MTRFEQNRIVISGVTHFPIWRTILHLLRRRNFLHVQVEISEGSDGAMLSRCVPVLGPRVLPNPPAGFLSAGTEPLA